MGGLAGMLQFRGDPPDPRVLEAMSDRLRHRGPDAEGRFADGPVAMAHRRRGLGPSRSRQPVVSDDLVLMIDGWIHDHEAVGRIVGTAAGEPDTVVLLAAWRRWGPKVVDHVDGSYAVAAWDRKNHTLYLVRDRMGARPLYWARLGGSFAFASELPALLAVPWVSKEVAREHLAEYLSFRVVHAPRTLLRDVHQVEPAHVLRVNADEVRSTPWWRPAYAKPGTARPSDGDVVDGLQEAVDRAVQRRIVKDVPTALYLSGGLGSTAIAAAARRLGEPIPTWTVSFADDENTEAPFAGRVAALLGLEHHEVAVGSSELAGSFVRGIKALGHPIGNPAVFLQLELATAVGAHARVVLSGDGGEELFGGRMLDGLVRQLRFATAFASLPYPLRRGIAAIFSRQEATRGYVAPVDRFGLDAELGGANLFSADERRGLLAEPALVRAQVRHDVLAPFYAGLDTDPVNAILNAYTRSWLQEESLPRADRTAAAAGMDVRFPLLDGEVIARAAMLPGASKVRRVAGSLHTRWPLRSMLDGVIPPPLVNRPKRGMPVPLDPWLAGAGRLFMDERFAALKRDRMQLWTGSALDRLRSEVGKTPGAGLRLWALFILDAWMEYVLKG